MNDGLITLIHSLILDPQDRSVPTTKPEFNPIAINLTHTALTEVMLPPTKAMQRSMAKRLSHS
jgi:hypothetical protein